MILENDRVRLLPLGLEHVDALVRVAAEDRSTFGLTPVPSGPAETEAYVRAALADQDARRAVPFAVVRRADGDRIVGTVRFMNLEWWTWPPGPIFIDGDPRDPAAGAPPDVAEIGAAWLARSVQRTEVNTAMCTLMMTYAFEVWRVHRLFLKTDARNERSRNAILRLGGVFEGVLRAHMPSADGRLRDTAMFSIVAAEWPAVKRGLEARA
jgi:RimJ/RimL family protein N-acetyltransferase